MGSANRRQLLLGVLAVLLAAGCGPTAATPTDVPPTATPTEIPPTATQVPTETPIPEPVQAASIEEIVGTWYSAGKGIYLRIYEDGAFHQSHSLEDLDDRAFARGEIWFEGTRMSLRETGVLGVPSCGDTVGIYEAVLHPDGSLQLKRVSEACTGRGGDTALMYEPVE